MKADWKAKWVQALRSGEYAQAQLRLRSQTSDRFCCLGVLCDLIDKDEDNAFRWKWDGKEGMWFFAASSTSLDDRVCELVGLEEYDPSVIRNETKISLTTANDTYGLSFSEIADLVEAQL